MTDGHCFISYSHVDGLDFAFKLANELESGHPFIKTWIEKKEIKAGGDDWDDQLDTAIKKCKCLLFVMSQDSTAKHSNCKLEWSWALKEKRPIICIWIDNNAEDQFKLYNRQKIDFTSNFDSGLAQLRKAIDHIDSFEGEVEELNRRLADTTRSLRRAKGSEENKIKLEIEEIKAQLKHREEMKNSVVTELQENNSQKSNSEYSKEALNPVFEDDENRLSTEVRELREKIHNLEKIGKDPKARKDFDESRLYLEFIHTTIARLSGYSTLVKSFMVVVVSAILVLYIIIKIEDLVLVAILPTLIFWSLDAYYLWQERKFRGLYNDVAGLTKESKKIPLFAMRPDLYTGGKYSYWDVFRSQTLIPLYMFVLIIIYIVYFFF